MRKHPWFAALICFCLSFPPAKAQSGSARPGNPTSRNPQPQKPQPPNAKPDRANPLIAFAGVREIPFLWLGDTVNGQWDPYAAILLPLPRPSGSKPSYFQFDLGAPYSFLYKSRIRVIFHIGKDRIGKSGERIPITRAGLHDTTRADFHDTTAVDPGDTTGADLIGTIGVDLIRDKVLIIDYPAGKLVLRDSLSQKEFSPARLTALVFEQGRIFLPAVIKGGKTLLFFDTGSSSFELITDSLKWQALSDRKARPSVYPVQSWGRQWIAHTIGTSDSIGMAFQQIPIRHVTYISGASHSEVQEMMKWGIGGLTGNRLFLGYILAIDLRNKQFGLIWKGAAWKGAADLTE